MYSDNSESNLHGNFFPRYIRDRPVRTQTTGYLNLQSCVRIRDVRDIRGDQSRGRIDFRPSAGGVFPPRVYICVYMCT